MNQWSRASRERRLKNAGRGFFPSQITPPFSAQRKPGGGAFVFMLCRVNTRRPIRPPYPRLLVSLRPGVAQRRHLAKVRFIQTVCDHRRGRQRVSHVNCGCTNVEKPAHLLKKCLLNKHPHTPFKIQLGKPV